ncbi:Importin subunit alpha-7 [Armadillidium vulgare]|nr:Importin subunit alpha-7 [Armadillidium vulgare]
MEMKTDEVIEAGVVPLLVRHIDHPSSNVRKDCAWALSNITAGSEEQIQKVIDADGLPKLAKIIQKDDPRVRKEAIWCVSNLTQSGSQEQVDETIKQGLLQSLAMNTSSKSGLNVDKQLLHVALEGMNNMLEKCSNKNESSEIMLKTLSRKDIEKLTYDEDKAVKSVSAKIQLLLSEDE